MRGKTPIILVTVALMSLVMLSCGTTPPLQVGDTAPDFTLESVDGNSISLSDFRGKVVLLVFTSVKCVDCEKQMPYIEAVYKESGEKLAVLDIYMFNYDNIVWAYITAKEYTTFPALPDPKGTVGRDYGVTERDLPTSFFIDPEGVISYRRTGRFQDQEEIENILNSMQPTTLQ